VVAKTTTRVEVPCEQCMAAGAICYKKMQGPGCWQCSKRKSKCSAAAPWETGRSRGWRGEGLEGLSPPAMVTIDEEVMGLLRQLVGALERGVEVLEAMEDHYRRMGEWVWDDKVEESEEDKEEDEEENTEGGVEEVTGAVI